ncbi:hypothetical protein Tco_0326905, partial [Tanacetum coccineum]
ERNTRHLGLRKTCDVLLNSSGPCQYETGLNLGPSLLPALCLPCCVLAPFHKYLEPFLCLMGLSRYYTLDEDTYPEFLDDDGEGERQRGEDEPKLLDTTVGRVVPLLPVAPAHAKSEEGVGLQLVTEDVASLQLRRHKKKKTIVADAGRKSKSVVKQLLAEAVQNAKVRGGPIPTLPFVTSSVSATPECEDDHHTDFAAILLIFGPAPRFVISSSSSHHSGAKFAEAEVDSVSRSSAPIVTTTTTVTTMVDVVMATREVPIKPSLFGFGSSSAGGTETAQGGFSDLTGNEFLVCGIRTVTDPDSDLQKVFVSRWNVTNGSRLDDNRDCHEMVDEFAPPKFFASVRGMEHDQLFAEFHMGYACQMTLSAEVRMRAEYNIKEKRRLKSIVDDQVDALKVKEKEMEDLKAQLLLREAEVAEVIRLRAEVSKFQATEKSLRCEVEALRERNMSLEKEKGMLDIKVVDLAAMVKVRKQEAADVDVMVTSIKLQNDRLVDHFYPHLLNTIAGRRWLLTHGIELAISKCLNSTEYLSALGAAICKAVEKGMQDGLYAGITHGAEGRTLTDVAAYNQNAEADYLSALQRLQSVNFSLVAELKSNKDANTKAIMDLLKLEDNLAARLGLTESQPHVNQLMVPIHHSPDHRVIGASALSLSLDVSNFRVQKIRENLAHRRSALQDVFVSLSEPLSIAALTGTGGTSDVIPAIADTTTALSVSLVSSSSIPPISTDDYEIVHVDGRGGEGTDDQAADGNVDPFPNVDDVDLNIQ